ncbi:hypothetical protein N7G274_008164 [Stereocaulon virgatum]|uniref:Uncharacterized protein n=1 Tax=Stereocaulon virgatum TaxID=373712 RepID=A0ABR4A0Z1_9LECA
MQLLTPITLVLLAGSTLAMPIINDILIHEQRGHHGWVGSGFTDLNCNGQPVGDRPEIHYFDCIKFKPSAYGADKFIAINYGTSIYKFHELAFYSGLR